MVALFFASSINDQGQIIGFAFNHATSASGTFLLTPVPEPETYAILVAGLGLLGLTARKRRAPADANT